MSATKRCGKCKQHKPRAEFHARKESSDGLVYWCKQCYRERDRRPKLAPALAAVTRNGLCRRCCGLSHRVVGERCGGCGLRRQSEAPPALEDCLHSSAALMLPEAPGRIL